MEPADLNSPAPPSDDPLDALLRRPVTPLPDHGFSRSVLAALPARPSSQSKPRRAFVIAAGALAGLAFAIFRIGSPAALTSDWLPLQTALTQAATSFNDPAPWIALLIGAASVLFALHTPRRQ